MLHRLNTIHIHIPPLRERIDDIEPLLTHYTNDFARKLNKPVPVIEKEAINALLNYSFPGNVRELRNMIERAIILCKTESLKASDFQTYEGRDSEKEKEKVNFNLEENELKLVQLALKEMNYNQNKTDELLGITRDALIRRMKKYNIKVSKSSNAIVDE